MLSKYDIRHLMDECQYPGLAFKVGEFDPGAPSLPTLCLQVVEPGARCNDTGARWDSRGRKWHVSRFSTRSEIVQTAFKAVLTYLEHEAREKFTYRGARVLGPHIDLDKVVASGVEEGVREEPVSRETVRQPTIADALAGPAKPSERLVPRAPKEPEGWGSPTTTME